MIDLHAAYEIGKMQLEERRREAAHERLIRLATLRVGEPNRDRPFHGGTPHSSQNNHVLFGGLPMSKFLTDTRLVFGRSLIRTVRNPMWIIVLLFQPLLYLLLFAPLLEGLQLPGFGQADSLRYFVPGALIMIAFNAAFFGLNILDDLRDGVVERLRVTPASRLALLLGIVLQDVLVFLLQCGTLVAVALIMGLRPDWTGTLFLFGLLVLVGLAMVSFSYGLALRLQDQGALAGLLSTVTVPLLLLSGVLLPMTLAPDILQTVSRFNPFTHAVDAARSLMNGHLGDASVPRALGLFASLMLLALFWAVRVFRRSTA